MNNYSILRQVTIIVVLLFLYACPKVDINERTPGIQTRDNECNVPPEWYNNIDVCPDGMICGFQQSESLKASVAEKGAKAKARDDLAATMSSQVLSEYDSAYEEGNAIQGDTYSREVITDFLTLAINKQVQNAIVFKYHPTYCPNNGKHVIFVGVKFNPAGINFNAAFESMEKSGRGLTAAEQEFKDNFLEWKAQAKKDAGQ